MCFFPLHPHTFLIQLFVCRFSSVPPRHHPPDQQCLFINANVFNESFERFANVILYAPIERAHMACVINVFIIVYRTHPRLLIREVNLVVSSLILLIVCYQKWHLLRPHRSRLFVWRWKENYFISRFRRHGTIDWGPHISATLSLHQIIRGQSCRLEALRTSLDRPFYTIPTQYLLSLVYICFAYSQTLNSLKQRCRCIGNFVCAFGMS